MMSDLFIFPLFPLFFTYSVLFYSSQLGAKTPSAEETKNAIYLSRTIVNFVQEKIKFKLNL